MDIEDLRTFVEVALAGGVSPAARRLGVPKSIVSRRLQRLETDLGVQLFARTTRGAVLTEAGATFRDRADRICSEMDTAREEMAPEGELHGLLRVTGPASFGYHFAPVLAELAHEHPQLHVHTRYSDRYVDLVAEGFDCGIRVGYLPDSNLVARRIGSFAVSLYASPEYVAAYGTPKTPDEIANHQAIMIGTESWKFADGKKSNVVNPQGRFKSDSAVGIAEATAAGIGVAALPDVIAESYVADGKIVPIMKRYTLPAVGIFVVRPPGPRVPRKVRVLIDLLAARFG